MWISIEKRTPEIGELCFVYGKRNSELAGETGTDVGFVIWGTAEYSSCKDTCYYDVWYSDITHWQPAPTFNEFSNQLTQ